MEQYKNVNEFIEKSPSEAQSILYELRKIILDTFPDIDEAIGYGVPQYKLGKKEWGFRLQKHMSQSGLILA